MQYNERMVRAACAVFGINTEQFIKELDICQNLTSDEAEILARQWEAFWAADDFSSSCTGDIFSARDLRPDDYSEAFIAVFREKTLTAKQLSWLTACNDYRCGNSETRPNGYSLTGLKIWEALCD